MAEKFKRKWNVLVRTSDDESGNEDLVEAEGCKVLDSGALLFYNSATDYEGNFSYVVHAYSAGLWVEMWEASDGEEGEE